METRWYKEYKMTPDWKNKELAEEFWSTMGLLKMLDHLGGLVDVRPDHSGCEHNRIIITVDNVRYHENIIMWNRRFE